MEGRPMMTCGLRLLVVWAALLAGAGAGVCQTIETRGQLSAWLAFHKGQETESQIGIRALPAFSLKQELGRTTLNTEASFNVYGLAALRGSQTFSTDGRIKPYRLWARFSTPRFEARLGLQKINFGSALLLRPLMWFDRIDPNDPLQLTDGVYGALARYTFVGNANIWIWGLLGNVDAKGWEFVPTKSRTPEFGGRFQVPLLSGEAAFSFHHRLMDPSRSLLPLPAEEAERVPENRFALDGKWDVGAGVWFEGVLVHQDFRLYPFKYQRFLNLGADYTFGLGNGLHVIAEHLISSSSDQALSGGESLRLTAVAADYPLGLLDRIKAVIFHNWKSGDWYRLITWQRTYDKWSFFAIGFWNPDRYQIYSSQQGRALFAGKGLQIMAVFNY
jgi:hypothetical protein